MQTIPDALVQLKAILAAGGSPTGQSAPSGVYVFPTDYGTIDGSLTLPVVICSEFVGQENQIVRKAAGLARHDWQAEILYLVSRGENAYPNQGAADAEALHTGIVAWLRDTLFPEMTLNGTAERTGEGGAAGSVLFRYVVDHYQWNRTIYWGVRAALPVMQISRVTMAAG